MGVRFQNVTNATVGKHIGHSDSAKVGVFIESYVKNVTNATVGKHIGHSVSAKVGVFIEIDVK